MFPCTTFYWYPTSSLSNLKDMLDVVDKNEGQLLKLVIDHRIEEPNRSELTCVIKLRRK